MDQPFLPVGNRQRCPWNLNGTWELSDDLELLSGTIRLRHRFNDELYSIEAPNDACGQFHGSVLSDENGWCIKGTFGLRCGNATGRVNKNPNGRLEISWQDEGKWTFVRRWWMPSFKPLMRCVHRYCDVRQNFLAMVAFSQVCMVTLIGLWIAWFVGHGRGVMIASWVAMIVFALTIAQVFYVLCVNKFRTPFWSLRGLICTCWFVFTLMLVWWTFWLGGHDHGFWLTSCALTITFLITFLLTCCAFCVKARKGEPFAEKRELNVRTSPSDEDGIYAVPAFPEEEAANVREQFTKHYNEGVLRAQKAGVTISRRLKVEQVYKVQNASLEKQFDRRRQRLSTSVDTPDSDSDTPDSVNERRLYHGTSLAAILAIACSGFKLPQFPGMYGIALYFADMPFKSWTYCHTGGTASYMLACDVLLGRTRQMTSAATDLRLSSLRDALAITPDGEDFQHDSVYGATRPEGGALRCFPEYMVYQSDQAFPRYVLKVSKE